MEAGAANSAWSSACDPSTLAGDALLDLAMDVFVASGTLEPLGVDAAALRAFTAQVRAHYRANAYHCFAHAVHVLLNAHRLLRDLATDAFTAFTAGERFALLFAALVHDLDHPGHTNMFEIERASALARLYNDQSVLEMHSISLAYELADGCNLFAGLRDGSGSDGDGASARRVLRARVVEIVLATDIGPPSGSDRGALVKFKWDKAFAGGCSLAESAEQRMCVLVQLMRAADVGSAMQPYHIFANWSHRLARENHKAFGLTPEAHTKTQGPFMGKYCMPLIRLIRTFPILKSAAEMEDNVAKNLERWQGLSVAEQCEDLVKHFKPGPEEGGPAGGTLSSNKETETAAAEE
jgi:hypothetical protein